MAKYHTSYSDVMSLLSGKEMNGGALAVLAALKHTTETSRMSVVNVRSQLSC